MALKKLFLFLNYKNRPKAWGFTPRPPLKLNYFTRRVSQFRNFHFLTIRFNLLPLAISWFVPDHVTTSELPFYDIFVRQKVPLSKIYDDVIVCDLWFAPPNQKFWLRLWLKSSFLHILLLINPLCSNCGLMLVKH